MPGLAFANGDFVEREVIPWNELIVSAAAMVGVFMFIIGLYSVKQNAFSPQQNPLSSAFSKMFAGLALISAGPMYAFLNNSTMSDSLNVDDRSVLSVSSSTLMGDVSSSANSWLGEHLPQATIEAIMGFVYLAGLFAFIKGLYLLKNVAGQNQSQAEGGFGRSLTHIFGGFVTMNITTFSCMIGGTLGISMMCIA